MKAVKELTQELHIGADGKVYQTKGILGGKTTIPLTETDIKVLAVGLPEGGKEQIMMHQYPDERWRVPQEVLNTWGKVLLKGWPTTEVSGVIGKSKKAEGKWVLVMPKQEVTSAHVDWEDVGPALEQMHKQGAKTIGTIHTHPGGMTGYSGTDESKMYKDFNGIHYIVAKTGDVGVYYAVGGHIWNLDKWKYLNVKEQKGVDMGIRRRMVSEEGKVSLRGMATEKVYAPVKMTWWQGDYSDRSGAPGARWQRVGGLMVMGEWVESHWAEPETIVDVQSDYGAWVECGIKRLKELKIWDRVSVSRVKVRGTMSREKGLYNRQRSWDWGDERGAKIDEDTVMVYIHGTGWEQRDVKECIQISDGGGSMWVLKDDPLYKDEIQEMMDTKGEEEEGEEQKDWRQNGGLDYTVRDLLEIGLTLKGVMGTKDLQVLTGLVGSMVGTFRKIDKIVERNKNKGKSKNVDDWWDEMEVLIGSAWDSISDDTISAT